MLVELAQDRLGIRGQAGQMAGARARHRLQVHPKQLEQPPRLGQVGGQPAHLHRIPAGHEGNPLAMNGEVLEQGRPRGQIRLERLGAHLPQRCLAGIIGVAHEQRMP